MFLLHQCFSCNTLKILSVAVLMAGMWSACIAQAADDPELAAAKAAHAEIVGSAPKAQDKPEAKSDSRRVGTATPDEVALRIAAKLAELRIKQAKQAAAKSTGKRLSQQATAQPRHVRVAPVPVPTRQSVASCPNLDSSPGDAAFI